MLIFLPLFAPSTQQPHSLRQSPNDCSCPWVIHISSLATLFPILQFISPWLFCNYLFLLLKPLTSSPNVPNPPPIYISTIKLPSVSMICLSSFCLSFIVRFYCSSISIFATLLFIVFIFFFLNKSL